MQAVRYSRQREAIKNYLMSATSHPTAEMVYSNVKERFDCGDGFIHFDGCTEPHDHFFCRKCKALSDIEMDSIEHIDKIANAGFNGIIEGHTVIFYGICHKCVTMMPDSKIN